MADKQHQKPKLSIKTDGEIDANGQLHYELTCTGDPVEFAKFLASITSAFSTQRSKLANEAFNAMMAEQENLEKK